jgi:hypothetical protein
MKWVGRIFLAVAVAGLAWWLWERVFVSDEQRVQRQLSAMARAVETGNLLKLEDSIAQDYADEFGFDKSTILAGIRRFRAQHDAVLIFLSDVTVQLAADRQAAEAVFIAKVLAKPKGAAADTELRADRYRVYFRRTETGWKMTRAETPQLRFE